MRTVAAAACLLIATSAVMAQAQGDAAAGRGDARSPAERTLFPADPYYVASPDQIIRQGLDRTSGFLMGAPGASPAALREFLELQIAPHFDFAYMARWAAGPLQQRLTLAQRAALAARLRALFLDALARHLGTLERPLPRVDVFPARPGHTMREARVFARVSPQARPPVRLEFRFYWSREGWRVYDVVANGASAVGFYRRYFTALLRRHGPDAVLG